MKTILVTGGCGFIGSHLCEALLKDPHHFVVCIDNFDPFYDPIIKRHNIAPFQNHERFKLYESSILDLDALRTLFETHPISTIVHLAARAGVRPSIQLPKLYYQVNVEGSLNILELAREFGVKKILCASSSSVYGANTKVPFSETDSVDYPVSPYAATKKALELLCYTYHHLYQLPIACLRFFTVYGPRQRPEMAIHKFAHMMSENQEIPVYNYGHCYRDFTYISDIIDGIYQIFQSDFQYEIVNIGESAVISTLDLVALLEQELNIKARMKLLPMQPGDVEKTYADITKAKNQFGYKPHFPIEKGIKEFCRWFKAKNREVQYAK